VRKTTCTKLASVIEHVPYGTLPDQFGEYIATVEDAPLVVLIHGGFWRDQYRLDLMHGLRDDLAEHGFSVWNIEYRRVGPSGGGWDTTTADVAAAIDHAANQGWAEHGLAVVGHSAGGHLALWNASRPNPTQRPDLTVGQAPVADVIAANRHQVGRDATANFVGGDVDDVPDCYAHVQPRPLEMTGRVMVIHGTDDENVPIWQSTNLDGHVDVVHTLHGVDHFNVIDPAHPSWTLVRNELQAMNPS
jgi:acetyl esterase/lipase